MFLQELKLKWEKAGAPRPRFDEGYAQAATTTADSNTSSSAGGQIEDCLENDDDTEMDEGRPLTPRDEKLMVVCRVRDGGGSAVLNQSWPLQGRGVKVSAKEEGSCMRGESGAEKPLVFYRLCNP